MLIRKLLSLLLCTALLTTDATAQVFSGGVKITIDRPLVLCIGDSITYGTANGNFGFRARLQSLLGVSNYKFVGTYHNPVSDQTYSVNHAGLKVSQPDTDFNTGYTASMNTRGRAELNERFRGSATNSIMIYHGGTNNVKQESGGFLDEAAAINEIADNPLTTASLVGYTVANFPTVKLYIALIVPSPNAANDAAFTSYNAALKTRLDIVRGTYTQVHYVDHNANFKALSGWETTYMADTLHPTAAGYNAMADLWYSCIQSSSNTYCDGN